MKNIFLVIGFLILSSGIHAQKYFTKTGSISFFSSTSMEDIVAHNKTVTAIFDSQTGVIQYSVTMKSFHFKKALMQEHFNDNYIESDQFPKATFKGKIENVSDIQFNKNGTYTANITGSLKMHGVTKIITTTATFTVTEDGVLGESIIILKPADFEIKIPSIVREKIAKEIEVTITMHFKEK